MIRAWIISSSFLHGNFKQCYPTTPCSTFFQSSQFKNSFAMVPNDQVKEKSWTNLGLVFNLWISIPSLDFRRSPAARLSPRLISTRARNCYRSSSPRKLPDLWPVSSISIESPDQRSLGKSRRPSISMTRVLSWNALFSETSVLAQRSESISFSSSLFEGIQRSIVWFDRYFSNLHLFWLWRVRSFLYFKNVAYQISKLKMKKISSSDGNMKKEKEALPDNISTISASACETLIYGISL